MEQHGFVTGQGLCSEQERRQVVGVRSDVENGVCIATLDITQCPAPGGQPPADLVAELGQQVIGYLLVCPLDFALFGVDERRPCLGHYAQGGSAAGGRKQQ